MCDRTWASRGLPSSLGQQAHWVPLGACADWMDAAAASTVCNSATAADGRRSRYGRCRPSDRLFRGRIDFNRQKINRQESFTGAASSTSRCPPSPPCQTGSEARGSRARGSRAARGAGEPTRRPGDHRFQQRPFERPRAEFQPGRYPGSDLAPDWTRHRRPQPRRAHVWAIRAGQYFRHVVGIAGWLRIQLCDRWRHRPLAHEAHLVDRWQRWGRQSSSRGEQRAGASRSQRTIRAGRPHWARSAKDAARDLQ